MLKFKFNTGEEYYHRIYQIFNGLIAITLVPFVLLFLDIQKNGSENSMLSGTDAVITSCFLGLIYTGLFYFSIRLNKKGLKEIQSTSTLRDKLNNYYSVSLKKYIGLNVCCLIAVLGVFLTKYFLFIIGYVLSLIVLSIGRPVLKVIMKEIQLNPEEVEILSEKKPID